ncbi:hypothetical protein T484DRAFT_1825961 [Baffinella frigidus]|nr:hypothetical protein T484DRAFT_1825961 [Cryptophyta sp. CCMP2293]
MSTAEVDVAEEGGGVTGSGSEGRMSTLEVDKVDTSEEVDTGGEVSAKTLYQLVGLAKLPGCVEWLREALAASEGKFAVFAHHRKVMDGLQASPGTNALGGVPHVRIDGASGGAERHNSIAKFRTNPEVRVALVSVTAGGQGIDLTAASVAQASRFSSNFPQTFPGHARPKTASTDEASAPQVHFC